MIHRVKIGNSSIARKPFRFSDCFFICSALEVDETRVLEEDMFRVESHPWDFLCQGVGSITAAYETGIFRVLLTSVVLWEGSSLMYSTCGPSFAERMNHSSTFFVPETILSLRIVLAREKFWECSPGIVGQNL